MTGAVDASGSGARRTAGLLTAICMAELLLVLDSTVMIVAVVPLGRELGLAGPQLAWVVNGYSLTLGGFLLVGGRAADLFGRRKVFLLGVASFGVASAACGLAGSASAIIGARLAQGAAAALIAPAALGLLTVTFTTDRARSRALALWGTVSAVGGTAGVVLSGVVSQYLSWRWLFEANVLVVAAVLVVATRVLPHDGRAGSQDLDLVGALLATAALLSLVYCIERARWHTLWQWAVPLGLGLLSAWWERRAPEPLVPRRATAKRSRTVAVVAYALSGAALGGAFFVLTLTFQSAWGWPPARTGLVFVPFGSALLAGAWVGRLLQRRLGTRRAIVVSLGVAAAGMAVIALAFLPAGGSIWLLLPGLVVCPLGIGCAFVSLTMLALQDADDSDASLSGALLNVAQQIGNGVGVGVVAAVYGVVPSWGILAGSSATFALAVTVLVRALPRRHDLAIPTPGEAGLRPRARSLPPGRDLA